MKIKIFIFNLCYFLKISKNIILNYYAFQNIKINTLCKKYKQTLKY